MEQLIQAARKSGKPLDDQAIADLKRETEAAVANAKAQMDRRNAVQTSFSTGVSKALQDYQENAANLAKFGENLVTGSLSKLEDAFVNFAKTRKLSLSSLWQFMADEFLRQQARMIISGGISGIGSVLGSLGGSAVLFQHRCGGRHCKRVAR